MSKFIDRLVAKHLFELKVAVKDKTIYLEEGGEYYIKVLKMRTKIFDDGSGEWWEEIPDYSTDMNAAMLVVNELRSMDNCCIKFDLDVPGDIWRVEIKGNHYKCESKAVIDGIEELPMAICLAALKSLDNKKGYIQALALYKQRKINE